MHICTKPNLDLRFVNDGSMYTCWILIWYLKESKNYKCQMNLKEEQYRPFQMLVTVRLLT